MTAGDFGGSAPLPGSVPGPGAAPGPGAGHPGADQAGLASRRAAVAADRIYLGWQQSPWPADAGPPPRAPDGTALAEFSDGWLAAQWLEERRLDRPLWLAWLSGTTLACAVLAAWQACLLPGGLAGGCVAASAAVAGASLLAIRRGRRRLRAAIEAERRRIGVIRAGQRARLASEQQQHARRHEAWQRRRAALAGQPRWCAVWLPASLDRIDVAGGTLAGWSALLTMLGSARLSAGGEVTVVDLTDGAVAADLLAIARRCGIEPLVWVLPEDLPLLDLGTALTGAALADVLALTVAASDEPGSQADVAADAAILDRVIGVLGGSPVAAQVTAALRVLGQAGDPRADVAAGLLDPAALEQLSTLFGRGAADRVVIGRAWAMEARLRVLDQLGTAPVSTPPGRLRVAWLDRRAGPGQAGSRVLGSYLAVALARLLRQSPSGARWQHTLVLLGADKLRGEVLDRLEDACEVSGTGLVMAYRSIPAPVAGRLGRGNAAVAFMRLGNAQDAKIAAEQIGTEHRLVLSQLTDTVGTSLTGTVGDSYTSTIGTADSVAEAESASLTSGLSRSRGRSRPTAAGPFGDVTGTASRDSSVSRSDSLSWTITAGINAGTSWGLSTSLAVGGNSSLARGLQRSREFLVEQHELQRLPSSAVIVSHPSAQGRQVVLADANPAIIGLPGATLLSVTEVRAAPRPAPGTPARASGRAQGLGGVAEPASMLASRDRPLRHEDSTAGPVPWPEASGPPADLAGPADAAEGAGGQPRSAAGRAGPARAGRPGHPPVRPGHGWRHTAFAGPAGARHDRPGSDRS